MTDWQRVQALFDEALQRPTQERGAFLDQACAGDAALRARMHALFAAHEALESRDARFLSGLDGGRAAALVADDTEGEQNIGRYRLVRTLGRGGMGVVHLAHDPVLGRFIALKVLAPHLTGDAAANSRFLAEARAASALEHPHIATVHEVGEAADGRLFIAMAFYDGETLRERMKRGALPVDDAVAIATQLASALAAAHAGQVVHRDVKPENVMLTAHGAKLLDFGVAKVAAGALTRTGATVGTAAYMSPEQTRGESVDARADVWAVGVLLYEMLAGARPFSGASADIVIYGIRHDEPVPLREFRPELPPPLVDVVTRCLAKSAEARFTSGAELAAALRAVAGNSIARVLVPSETRGSALSWKRQYALLGRPRVVAPLMVLLAALVLAAGAALMRSGARLTDAHGFAGDAFAARDWVLVADVQADAGSAAVASAVREALAVDLQQSGFVNVLGRTQVASLLQRMGRSPADPLPEDVALEAAERAGAGAVLAVSVQQLGGQYLLSGRALRPSDGAELFAVRTSAGGDAVVAAVETLSREMRRRLGEQRAAIRRSRALPDVTTRSLDALRHYADAGQAAALRDHDAAVRLVNAALEADPGFAMAHHAAGVLAFNQLRFGDAVHHLNRAFELRSRLTDRERWHVEGIWSTVVGIEPQRAIDAYELLLSRYPDDGRAAINLATVLQTWQGRNEDAWRALQRVGSAEASNYVNRYNGIHTAFVTGRDAAADSLARIAEGEGFSDLAARFRIGRAFALGQLDSAIAQCDALLRAGGGSWGSADANEICGSIDVAAGRFETGIARLEQAQRDYMEVRRFRNVAHAAHGLAAAHAQRGEMDLAAARLESVLQRIPADMVPEPDRFIMRTSLLMHATLLGRPDLAAQVAAAYPDWPDASHWMARGVNGLVQAAAHAVAGEGAEAIALLRERFANDRLPVGWRVWLETTRGLAWDALGEADSAAVYLERAADPRFQAFEFTTKDRILLPFLLERLATFEGARGAAAAGRLAALRARADVPTVPTVPTMPAGPTLPPPRERR